MSLFCSKFSKGLPLTTQSKKKPYCEIQISPYPLELMSLGSSAFFPSLTAHLLIVSHTCQASFCLRTLALAVPSSGTLFAMDHPSLLSDLCSDLAFWRRPSSTNLFGMWNFPLDAHRHTYCRTFLLPLLCCIYCLSPLPLPPTIKTPIRMGSLYSLTHPGSQTRPHHIVGAQ